MLSIIDYTMSSPVLYPKEYRVYLRIIVISLLCMLDYLSLSFRAEATATEGGNEYIQSQVAADPADKSIEKIPAVKRAVSAPPSSFTQGGSDARERLCGNTQRPLESGIASWYGPGFEGKPMANTKPYNMEAATVAHRKLPLGTIVCIRNPANDRIVIAKVTDRGPFTKDPRIVDLSKGVARALDIKLGPVEISLLSVT